MDSETAFRGSSMRLIVRHEQAARAFVWIVAVLIGFAAVAQYITGLYSTGHRRSPWTFASPELSAQFQGTGAGSLSHLFDGSGQIGHVFSSLALAQTDQLITQEFRYHAPDAGEVFLVWGVNGWAVVPKRTRPAGTMIKDTVMHTPMGRDGDVFVVKVHVPAGATIDYGFLITKTRSGTTVKVWEADGDQDYHIVAEQDGVLEVQTRLASAKAETSVNAAEAPLVSQEIRYHMPEAGEVYLVWGINGWAVVPEETRPAGTVLEDGLMHTPMVQESETFITEMQVPADAAIDYGFLITRRSDGATVRIWEGIWEGVNAPAIATPGDVIEVQTALTLTGDHATLILTDVPLVTQEIRYHMPEAGEVYLVWGVNGWLAMPEEIRPPGTVVKEKLMHTPMAREEGTFSASVQAPAGATIEYSFLLTKEHTGADIEATWDWNKDYHVAATQDGVTEIRSTLSLKKVRRQVLSDIGLRLLARIALLVGIALVLRYLPQLSYRRTAVLALIALTLLGLALRLQAAGTAHRLLNVPAHLIGDEPRYEYLASGLLQGEFFQQPVATPVYPLFLAACYSIFGHSYAPVLYVQAFIGAATIPLTYRLARHFAGRRGSLFAAALIALNQALVIQVGQLLTESLYVFLLLVTLLALLWALKAPLVRRFLLAGGLLGICALLRPAIAFFPAFLPALLPRGWSLRRRAGLWVVYGGFMATVIAPWTYHNYRTYDMFMPFCLPLTMLWQGSPEFYHVMQQKENAITEVWAEELNPARNGGIDPASIEGDRHFTARAIASIRAEPGVYAWYSLQKPLYFWIGHPAASWDWPLDPYELRNYYSARDIAGVFGMRLLLVPVTLVSLVILRRRLWAFAPLLVLCMYHMMIYSITNAVARYSEPLYPVVATIIAAAASEVGYRRQVQRGTLRQMAQTGSRQRVAQVGDAAVRPRIRKALDYYAGGLIVTLLRPCVWILGHILQRDHTLQVRGDICFIKMLGGGSLVIAYPALLGLRRQYPSASFSLITTPGIKPFAEWLGVFNRIDTIDESSLLRLIGSGLRCLWRNLRVDTVVDLEVYSRLTTVLSTLTGARNRIGFYLEAVFWRRRLHTHLVFFNRFSGAYHWYDAIARLLGAEPATTEWCRRLTQARLDLVDEHPDPTCRIAVGHACSALGAERMLDERQWLSVFGQHLAPKDRVEVLFLGGPADRDLAARIIETLREQFPALHIRNLCGELSLTESLRTLSTCQEFWGIDSALLHYARLLGLQCKSYWGPTDPATWLRPIPGLSEMIFYQKIPCSPCVHAAEEPPCAGDNICIQSLFEPVQDRDSVFWLTYGTQDHSTQSDDLQHQRSTRPVQDPRYEGEGYL